ncbi:MAG: hypothetical protein ABFS19_02495 [Thermodesulfobacteriota bacterium]
MSTAHSPIKPEQSDGVQEFDLGLQIPAGFTLEELFPGDRLLRLHPLWFVDDFSQDGEDFSVNIKDYVTEEEFRLQGTLVYPQSDGALLDIGLNKGIESRIRFNTKDSTLKALIDSETGEIDEEDPLLLWVLSIREYIRIYLKKTPATLFFRLLMNRMVLDMNPSQRKICMMISKITAVELLVIVIVVVGYVIFNQ